MNANLGRVHFRGVGDLFNDAFFIWGLRTALGTPNGAMPYDSPTTLRIARRISFRVSTKRYECDMSKLPVPAL